MRMYFEVYIHLFIRSSHAGYGGNVGSDEFGRPIALLTSWTVGSYDIHMNWRTGPFFRYLADNDGAPRSVIMHELVHGLGFSIADFQSATNPDGTEKRMVETRPLDGEDIWHVISDRTLTVARDYFDCPTLDALPLMGENLLGRSSRGSHWETR